MFSNLNWWNVGVLLLLALFIFGDKLPQVISDSMRTVRNLRRMAQDATTDISRELGTDIRLEDLNPKTFVRKHLLSEAEQDALTKPIKGLSEDLAKQGRRLQEEVSQVGAEARTTVNEATSNPRPRRAGSDSAGQAPSAPVSKRRFDDVT